MNANGALPNPLDRVEDELRALLHSRERSDPAGHTPGLRLALHVIEEAREDLRAIQAEHVPGRVYGRPEARS